MEVGTLFAVVIFPKPWPPRFPCQCLSKQTNGTEVHLGSDTSGRPILTVSQPDQGLTTYRFQPIRLQGGGRAILVMSWSSEGASLRLNGRDVELDHKVQGKPFVLNTAEARIEKKPIFKKIDPNAASSHAEYIFLGTIADIDRRLIEGGPYNLLRAAGLLRQLFLDATPLIHEVNRSHRKRLEFETLDYGWQPSGTPQAHLQILDASLFPGAKTIKLDLAAFLKAPFLRTGNTTADIRDLITACANAKGGIHLGRARTSVENTILDWDKVFRVVGQEPSLAAVAAVCRIALKGLKPLVRLIDPSK